MQLIGEQKSFQRTELSVRSVSYMEVNEDRSFQKFMLCPGASLKWVLKSQDTHLLQDPLVNKMLWLQMNFLCSLPGLVLLEVYVLCWRG